MGELCAIRCTMQPCKNHTIAVIVLAQRGLVTTAEIPPLAQLFHQSRVYVECYALAGSRPNTYQCHHWSKIHLWLRLLVPDLTKEWQAKNENTFRKITTSITKNAPNNNKYQHIPFKIWMARRRTKQSMWSTAEPHTSCSSHDRPRPPSLMPTISIKVVLGRWGIPDMSYMDLFSLTRWTKSLSTTRAVQTLNGR